MAQTTIPHPARPVPAVLAPVAVPGPPATEDARTLVVREAARSVLERGWLQSGWYATAPRSLRQRLFGPVPGPDDLEAACLVAAVVVAGHDGGAFVHVDRDSGPAVDRVWEALQETRPDPAPTPSGAVAPMVRRARMRELVAWNDDAGRTRADVLGLVDRAISRTIIGQVR